MTRPRVPLDRSVCPEVKTVKCFSTETQTQTAYGSARDGGPWRGPGERALPSSAVGEPRGGGSEKHRGSHWHRQCGEATPCGLARASPSADGGACCLPVGLSRVFSRSVFDAAFLSLGRLLGPSAGQDQRKELCCFSPTCLSRSHALTCCHGKLYDGPIKQNRKKRRVERAVGFAGPRSPSGLREQSRL